MTDDGTLLQVALALIGILSIAVNASAYYWKKKADGELEAVRGEAAEAKATAEQTHMLAASVNRLAEAWAKTDERAAAERDHFAKVIATNAESKGKLTAAVEANTATVGALQTAVNGLPDSVAEKVRGVFTPVLERLDSIATEVSDTKNVILCVFGDETEGSGTE